MVRSSSQRRNRKPIRLDLDHAYCFHMVRMVSIVAVTAPRAEKKCTASALSDSPHAKKQK